MRCKSPRLTGAVVGDVGRHGDMWGGMGRSGEMWVRASIVPWGATGVSAKEDPVTTKQGGNSPEKIFNRGNIMENIPEKKLF